MNRPIRFRATTSDWTPELRRDGLRDRGEPIHLIGVACGRDERNLLKIKAVPA